MNRAQRAQQLWSILVIAAANRQILSYDLMAKATGVVRPSIGDFLRPIQQYCQEKGFPPLTSLIVSEKSGIPGEGFIAAEDVPSSQMQVFKFAWLEQNAPREEELIDAYSRAPDSR